MSGPANLLPFQPSGAAAFAVAATASTTSATDAVAIPDLSAPQVLITNTGAVIVYVTLGTDPGPDASVGTTRIPLLAGSRRVLTRRPGDTSAYFLAASSTAVCTIVSGAGY